MWRHDIWSSNKRSTLRCHLIKWLNAFWIKCHTRPISDVTLNQLTHFLMDQVSWSSNDWITCRRDQMSWSRILVGSILKTSNLNLHIYSSFSTQIGFGRKKNFTLQFLTKRWYESEMTIMGGGISNASCGLMSRLIRYLKWF